MKSIILEFVDLFKREPLIIFILCWLLFAGSTLSTYAVLILIPYVLMNEEKLKEIDGMFLLILSYSVIYATYSYVNGFYKGALGTLFFHSLYPPLFYLLGKWLVKTCEMNSIYWIFLILIGLIAVPVFIDVVNDIKSNQFINPTRLIERADGTTASSATNLGVRVSLAVASIGVITGKCNDFHERVFTIVLFVLSILGLTCVFHLVNRTGLVVAGVSIILVFLLNARVFSRGKIILIVLFLIIISFLYVPQMHIFGEVGEAYLARSDAYNEFSAGGRTKLWLLGIENLYKNPFGVKESDHFYYSHNYWLDTNMRGGILAFIFLLIVTFKHILNTISVIREFRPGLLRTLVITCNVGFFLTAFVEPIMEGFMVYVFILFFFIGMVCELRKSLELYKCE